MSVLAFVLGQSVATSRVSSLEKEVASLRSDNARLRNIIDSFEDSHDKE